MTSEAKGSGLENVNAADTAISHVDGEHGRLVIAGADAEQLALGATYEQATTRVLEAGGAKQIGELGLGAARDARNGMDALRAGMAHLWATGDDHVDAIAAIGAAPVFVAAWSRKQRGEAPVAPSADLDHATDYLRMT